MEAKDSESTDSSSCVVCGYSQETYGRTNYKGGLKVKETFVNDSDFFLGSEYVFKDRQLRPAYLEPATHAFLERETSIPIPKIKMFWEGEGERFRIIEERIQGETLIDIWDSLSETERDDIAQQTADYLEQLRGLTSSRLEGVDSAPLYSAILFGKLEAPMGPFDTTEGFWEALAEHLRGQGVPTEDINELGKDIPSLEPYTFTSARVDAACVVVKDKKVVGITDWGTTGYLPCWYEYAMASMAEPGADREWKQILQPKLNAEKYEAGAKWFKRFFGLLLKGGNESSTAKLSKDGAESLESNLAQVSI